jgi:hypothetical protein
MCAGPGHNPDFLAPTSQACDPTQYVAHCMKGGDT